MLHALHTDGMNPLCQISNFYLEPYAMENVLTWFEIAYDITPDT